LDFILFNFIFTYFSFIQFYLLNYFHFFIILYKLILIILYNLFFKIFFDFHRRNYKRNKFVGIFQRVVKYLLHMPQSPMSLFRWWFTDGNTDRIITSVYSREFRKNYCLCHYHRWKYTDKMIPSAYFQREFFSFGVHIPSIKPSVLIFFTDRISNISSNYRQTYSIREVVGKIYTNVMVILCWQKNSVGKKIKYYSVFN